MSVSLKVAFVQMAYLLARDVPGRTGARLGGVCAHIRRSIGRRLYGLVTW